MKGISLLSLFGVALAHPTGLWWGTDVCYTSPEKADNQCTPAQQVGFDWSQLGNGDNWSYDGFNFVGFTAKDGCRDSEDGTCIGGTLSRDDGYSLEVNTADTPFSIRTFNLSTSRETNVLITYEMPEGRPCHQVAFSTRQGIDVHNDQCGGATAVKFQLPEENKFGDCTLNIHAINFDCSSGEKHTGHPSSSLPTQILSTHSEPTHSVPTHSVPTHSVPTHSVPTHSGPTYSGPTQSVPTLPVSVPEHHHTSVWEVPTPSASVPEHHPTTAVVPHSSVPSLTKPMTTVWETAEVTITKCGHTVTDCPAHSTVVITSTYSSSTTVCPSSSTEPGSHIAPPTILPPSSIPTITSTVTGAISVPHTPTPVPCPELVPKCMNTWLSIPKCDSNSDAACFCPSSEFTGKVQSCIHAWGTSKHEVDSALSYFAGICAPYIPKNPTIIDIVPPSPPQPHTTVSAPQAEETPCTTITWSSHTVTVPQVGFNTVTGSSTTSVGLVVGTPASAIVTAPSGTGHHHHSGASATTTPCSTRTSTFLTTVTGGPTVSKPVPAPSESVVHANSGVRSYVGYLHVFGLGALTLALL
ncbi:unnamed protein product [Penicillium salamii]|nr:unnamed protein product [Penicillium salamii]CAG8360279.1 unnamed protein product [Penicillium salamii]